MCRTLVNVMGDLMACVTIDHRLRSPEERGAEPLGRVPTQAVRGATDTLPTPGESGAPPEPARTAGQAEVTETGAQAPPADPRRAPGTVDQREAAQVEAAQLDAEEAGDEGERKA